MTPRVALALALAVAALVAACGYSSERLVDLGGARTISVLPFRNASFYRDVELRLTQAVAREVRARTSLALSSADRADLLLTGTVNASEAVAIQGENRTSILQRLTGNVAVTVTDRRTGRVVKQFTVAAMTEFTPGRDGETLEGSATDEWTRRLALQVVSGLEQGF